MTPEKLRAIRQRTKAWDMRGVFGDRIALLEEVDRLTAEVTSAREAGWDECAEHLGTSGAATMDRPVTYLIATNPYRSQP